MTYYRLDFEPEDENMSSLVLRLDEEILSDEAEISTDESEEEVIE